MYTTEGLFDGPSHAVIPLVHDGDALAVDLVLASWSRYYTGSLPATRSDLDITLCPVTDAATVCFDSRFPIAKLPKLGSMPATDAGQPDADVDASTDDATVDAAPSDADAGAEAASSDGDAAADAP